MTTPLLVPSFSSKGFPSPIKSSESEVRDILLSNSEFVTDSFLISAYDIFHGNLPNPRELPATPDLLFLDSGGYEASSYFNNSMETTAYYHPRKWSMEDLVSVLDDWPINIPAVFVSFDHPLRRVSFSSQVASARETFRGRRDHLALLLLKPETETQDTVRHVVATASADINELGRFDIVGVTEKELGRTMLDRMVQIARLRLVMDKGDVAAPIHVFGALDPLSVCLYFISGAEIFDGLSWLRYGYHEGIGVYSQNWRTLNRGLWEPDAQSLSHMITGNYYAMLKLRHRLAEFHQTRDWRKLDPHGRLVSDAWDSLRAKLGKEL